MWSIFPWHAHAQNFFSAWSCSTFFFGMLMLNMERPCLFGWSGHWWCGGRKVKSSCTINKARDASVKATNALTTGDKSGYLLVEKRGTLLYVQVTTSEMVLNVIVNGMWWIIKTLFRKRSWDINISSNSKCPLVHLQLKESDPKGKDQKNVTYGMSKLFGHQLEQLTCLLKIRPSGLRICGLCAQECLISLKCQTARAVENGSNVSGHTRDYGNAISSL